MTDEGRPGNMANADIAGEGVQALVRTLRVLFVLLRVVIVLIAVYMVISGVFYVRDPEEAMLFRFGRLQAKDGNEVLTSGKWYWAWPAPVDMVKRVPAQRSVTITSDQFWPRIDPYRLEAPDAASQAEMAQALRPGEGGYLLTGDENIMHMIWRITYRINDAKRYYLSFYDDSEQGAGIPQDGRQRGAEVVIRNLLSEAVLNEVSTWPVESILVLTRAESETRTRETLASAVRRRTVVLVEDLDMGIEVQQVSLVEVQPPVATLFAFREVVGAAQEYRTSVEEAHAYERRVVTEAEGQASQILAEAQAYRTRVVESVKAQAGYFEKVREEYEKNPQTMLVALYSDAIREILNKVETKYVIHAKADGRQEIRLMLGPEPAREAQGDEPGMR